MHGVLARGVKERIQAAQCLQGCFVNFDSSWRYIMRTFLTLIALSVTLAAGVAQAAEPVKAVVPAAPAAVAAAAPASAAAPANASEKKPQQNKMKTCNADAAGKKGDERKAFMSECLKK